MRGYVAGAGRWVLALVVLGQLVACADAAGRQQVRPPARPPAASAATRPGATPAARGAAGQATLTAAPIATAQAVDAGLTDADFVAQVVALTNADRAANGCPPLAPNPVLMGTALAHSEDMALHHFFAHTGSDGSTPETRITAAGYAWVAVAENIAAGQGTPQEVVDTWFDETPPNDPHRANILNCALHDIGVGYYYIADDANAIAYHSYWTEDFGALVG